MNSSLYNQASALLGRIALQCSPSSPGYGSMSSTVYDAAWVSMVQKPPGSGSWLFPDCFDSLLRLQLPSGGWGAYASPADGILNTAAALLCLRKHMELDPTSVDWEARSRKAVVALQQMLNGWDVLSSDQVGFEILIVQHLSLLKLAGVDLDFAQRKTLQAVCDAKLQRLPISSLYKSPSTFLHSLEALIGYVDFDRLRGLRDENGSMMGSPSSTAAYLTQVSVWDDDAELYLRRVVDHAGENSSSNGGLPSAWPTTVFEAAWALTTLSSAGLSATEPEALSITDFLEKTFVSQKGLVGFAPLTLADSDDTARVIIALRYAGKPVFVQPLMDAFECRTHFQTYHGERNPSFSANCNVLTCLLSLDEEQRAAYTPQITKAVSFLCREAFKGSVMDKWHRHDAYWKMLLVQAFELLSDERRTGTTHHAVLEANPVLKEQIPMISCQILSETLQSQQSDGSWDGMNEVTAYAVLTLSSISCLPWLSSVRSSALQAAIENGKAFLLLHRDEWKHGNYLWIEKVTYASNALSEAYCIAAVASTSPSRADDMDALGFSLPSGIPKGLRIAKALIQQTSMKFDRDCLDIAELQAGYALLGLQRQRREIFPSAEERKAGYLPMTALIWMACHSRHQSSLSLSDLQEMMILSMVVYQVDDYVESIIEREDGWEFSLTEALIVRVCQENSPLQTFDSFPDRLVAESSKHLVNGSKQALERLDAVLNRIAAYILKHPAVLGSPGDLQARVVDEFRAFLLAHIQQARDNRRFRRQRDSATRHCPKPQSPSGTTPQATEPVPLEYESPSRTFYSWVRTTSADHTSCPVAWAFFNCLLTKPSSQGVLATARTAYVAEDLCRHLASMCRMYNDYASLARDADETNLNSLNFPEFRRRSPQDRVAQEGEKPDTLRDPNRAASVAQDMKSDLMWVAEYERRGLDLATRHLAEELGSQETRLVEALRVFIDVTDLYGLVYLVKDLTSRVQ